MAGLSLGALIGAGQPAAAETAPKVAAKLSADEQARLRSLRDEARAAAKKNDHAAAAAATERALALQPGDDRLLSELGWQRFLAKDLVRAEAATRQAIAVGGRARPASLYNLGRILEEKGDKPAAAKAYQESLALRPNRTVQQALARVDPSAAVAASPAPRGSDDALAPEALAPGAAEARCEVVAKSDAAIGAISGARVVSCGDDYEPRYQLVLDVAGQSFLHSLHVDEPAGGNLSVHARLGTSGGHLLVTVVRSESTHGGRDKRGEQSWLHTVEEFVSVCGVGPSRKPHCTPQLQVSFSEDKDDVVRGAWELRLTVSRDALSLEVGGPGRKKLPAEPRRMLGRHPLVFP